MSIITTREQRRALERENAKISLVLERVPKDRWPSHPDNLTEVWRSRGFLVQVFAEAADMTRLSVCRTSIDASSGRWKEDITWEELQRLKRECGRGHLDAVEIYPADRDVVNVANMRHLWVMDRPLSFAWRKA
jgi:hypothetical protein